MLSGDQIRERKLINNAVESGFRAASYDLHIEKLIKPDGAVTDSYSVPPQGIVEVVSRERLNIPDNVVGLAMVKTSLCNYGLLALNIGIIDPGWNGPISSFLINFGRNNRLLTKGEVFLRISCHSLDEPSSLVKRVNIQDEEYMSEVISKFAAFVLALMVFY